MNMKQYKYTIIAFILFAIWAINLYFVFWIGYSFYPKHEWLIIPHTIVSLITVALLFMLTLDAFIKADVYEWS